MIKKTVSYYDFDNNHRTEDLYFNMTKSELLEFAFDLPEDMTNMIDKPEDINDETAKKLIEKIGNAGIYRFVKDLIIKSYGVKSSDGRRFIKDEQTVKEFTQSLAFDAFMLDLFSDDKKATAFINGLIPNDMAKQIPTMHAQN